MSILTQMMELVQASFLVIPQIAKTFQRNKYPYFVGFFSYVRHSCDVAPFTYCSFAEEIVHPLRAVHD